MRLHEFFAYLSTASLADETPSLFVMANDVPGGGEGWFARMISSAWGVLLFSALLLAGAANLRSCVTAPKSPDKPATRISEANVSNPRHFLLMSSTKKLWAATRQPEDRVVLAIAEGKEINAASFGRGRFVFWDGVADLPVWAVDAIAAHEVAHDRLRHSRKAAELKDVTSFLGEILGLLGGTSQKGQEVLADWVDLAALPKYSRAQEFEADREAVELLRAVGYERPDEVFANALRLVLEKHGDTGGSLFDSHPGTRERISRLSRAQ